MWKKAAVIVMCLAFLLSMTGCGGSGKESKEQNTAVREADTQNTAVVNADAARTGAAAADTTRSQAAENADAARTGAAAAANTSSQAAEKADAGRTGAAAGSPASQSTQAGSEQEKAAGGVTGAQTAAQYRGLIVIDPGHQQYGNSEQEPVGPGASETKAKVSGGTSGTASGVPEYQLTLDIGLQLRDELEARGYQVIMTRDTNEVDISNSERAAVANEADADAFIRIHANGSGNSGATGAMTICQTPGNVYNGDLYEESRTLADSVLNAYTEKTGIDYEYVWETDTMSGINWCRVPVTILEMGYMTNSEEDLQMQDSRFQEKMTDGIADGIDAFMADRTPKEH
jgi:N-acetylmuramoyl-L-alanine amidase